MIINTLLLKCYCFILDRCAGPNVIPFHGQEYTLEGTNYIYTLVLGKSITQKEKTGSGSWLLGNYANNRIIEIMPNDMEIYDNGDGCHDNIKRQATITFVKGDKTKVLEENEPSVCHYEYTFQINCHPGKVSIITLLTDNSLKY